MSIFQRSHDGLTDLDRLEYAQYHVRVARRAVGSQIVSTRDRLDATRHLDSAGDHLADLHHNLLIKENTMSTTTPQQRCRYRLIIAALAILVLAAGIILLTTAAACA